MTLLLCVTLSCVGERAKEPAGRRAHAVATTALGGTGRLTGPYAFSDVRGLAFDPHGRIVVTDAKAASVRVFATDGTYQFTVGVGGRSADQLREPCCGTIGPDGRLWVADQGNIRYRVFDLGEHTASLHRSIPMPARLSGVQTRVLWTEGGQLLHLADERLNGAVGLVRRILDTAGMIVRQDTLPEPPPAPRASVTINGASGHGVSRVEQPFGPRALRALDSHGAMAEAMSSEYAVRWLPEAGGAVRMIRGVADTPALSDRERDAGEATLNILARNLGVPRSAIPFGVPRHKTPLRALQFDLAERLWVERTVAEGDRPAADVYERADSLPTTIDWPANVRLDLLAANRTHVLGVTQRGRGLQQVVLLRIDSPGR